MRFTQNLEPVADANHRSAPLCVSNHFLHDRTESGNGSSTKRVTVTEASGQNQDIAVLRVVITMPQRHRRLPKDIRDRMQGVNITVRTRERHNAKLHRQTVTADAIT
jgi:hypothetical protein